MKITFKVYDHDTHRYLMPNEVRISPNGALWYKNGDEWQLYPPDAKFLTIESIQVTP